MMLESWSRRDGNYVAEPFLINRLIQDEPAKTSDR